MCGLMGPPWITKTLLLSGNSGFRRPSPRNWGRKPAKVFYYLLPTLASFIKCLSGTLEGGCKGNGENRPLGTAILKAPRNLVLLTELSTKSIPWRSCLCRNLHPQKSYCSSGWATAGKICRIFFFSKTTVLQWETMETVTWLDPVPILLGWTWQTEPQFSWML